MTRNETIDALNKLLPTQFEELVTRLQVPSQYLPSREAPLATRVADLVRYFEQRENGIERIVAILNRIVFSETQEEPKSAEGLLVWLRRYGQVLQQQGTQIRFEFMSISMICMYDEHANRMRIIAPISSVNDISTKEEHILLQANFDTALDARYAIFNDVVWAVYLHPLDSLIEQEFYSALQQTAELAKTFGTSYSSSTWVFRGSDRAKASRAEAIINYKVKKNIYDVFLCYNSEDKTEVKGIAKVLEENSVRPWADWGIRPGTPWQQELESQIASIKSAAIFIGKSGIGPWQRQEVNAFLREFIKRDCPVIPVILETATSKPELPIFLNAMQWVDFSENEPSPLEQLIWGITGDHG